jgi:large subunit ribosomal protein L20
MTRVKRGSVARKRRRKIFQLPGPSSNLFRTANQQALRSMQSASIDRHTKKIQFRQLWIRRINASSRLYGISYSQFIYKLKILNILLNRKVLAQLAILDPYSFKQLFDPLIKINT